MTYFLFVDETGSDHQESPYEVLAGAAIHDTQLWDLVCDINDAEQEAFGRAVHDRRKELKATDLLKRKTFKLASQLSPIAPLERARLAAELLAHPNPPTKAGLTAHAQAKLAFVERVLEICGQRGVRLFASIVPHDAPRPARRSGLRKDYGYLFERFFYWIDSHPGHERGVVVFDELERTQSTILINQMHGYFRSTATGRLRSGRVVPEPFFVHSDLTTGIRIADLVAYLVSWNVRVKGMNQPVRHELDGFGQRVLDLRHRAVVDRIGWPGGFAVWSFAVIDDLRSRSEREPWGPSD